MIAPQDWIICLITAEAKRGIPMSQPVVKTDPLIQVEIVKSLSEQDLSDLCRATEAAIASGGGFGWITPPARETLQRYWDGVLTVPERTLMIVRVDGVISGAAQLVEPARNNEAQLMGASLAACFIAPWARGQGAGEKLIRTTEHLAAELGYMLINLDVRETQEAAIGLCKKLGWRRWGINPHYAYVNGKMIAGHYFTKILKPLTAVSS